MNNGSVQIQKKRRKEKFNYRLINTRTMNVVLSKINSKLPPDAVFKFQSQPLIYDRQTKTFMQKINTRKPYMYIDVLNYMPGTLHGHHAIAAAYSPVLRTLYGFNAHGIGASQWALDMKIFNEIATAFGTANVIIYTGPDLQNENIKGACVGYAANFLRFIALALHKYQTFMLNSKNPFKHQTIQNLTPVLTTKSGFNKAVGEAMMKRTNQVFGTNSCMPRSHRMFENLTVKNSIPIYAKKGNRITNSRNRNRKRKTSLGLNMMNIN